MDIYIVLDGARVVGVSARLQGAELIRVDEARRQYDGPEDIAYETAYGRHADRESRASGRRLMMSVEVRINRDVIGTIEILNVTANGPDPELPIHTYDWTYSGQGFAGERVHKLDGRIEHRYRDGAIVLAHNVLAAVASRYQVVAHLGHDAAKVDGCPFCDDLADADVVDAEIYCGSSAEGGKHCDLLDGHDGRHENDEGEEWGSRFRCRTRRAPDA